MYILAESLKRLGLMDVYGLVGIPVTEAAYAMAEKYGVEMPITKQLYDVIKGSVKGPEAVKNLMLRERKHEGV